MDTQKVDPVKEQMLNEIIQGTIALQTFAANAKYVEMIVDIAFAVVPTILGLGAAGLIGNSAIKTAKDVMGSISVLQNLGPGLRAGMDLQKMRWEFGKRLQQSGKEGVAGRVIRGVGITIAFDQWIASKVKNKLKKNNQNTQGKQEEQSSGGSGGSPPTPPDIKADKEEEQAKTDIKASDKKEERPKPTGIETYSPIDALNPFKKKE